MQRRMIGASRCGYPYCPRPAVAATIKWEMARSVLIVDDHPSFRASARMLLECEGCDGGGRGRRRRHRASPRPRACRPTSCCSTWGCPTSTASRSRTAWRGNGGPAVVLISSRECCDYGTLAEGSGARGFITKAELSGETLEALLAMTSLRRALWLLAFLGVVAGVVPLALALESDHVDNRGMTAGLRPAGGLGVHRHRPVRLVAPAGEPLRRADDGRGLHVVHRRAVGVRRPRAVHRGPAPGRCCHTACWCTCCSPSPAARWRGGSPSPPSRPATSSPTVMQLAWILTVDTTREECGGCPANPLLLWDDQAVADAISSAQSALGIAGDRGPDRRAVPALARREPAPAPRARLR